MEYVYPQLALSFIYGTRLTSVTWMNILLIFPEFTATFAIMLALLVIGQLTFNLYIYYIIKENQLIQVKGFVKRNDCNRSTVIGSH